MNENFYTVAKSGSVMIQLNTDNNSLFLAHRTEGGVWRQPIRNMLEIAIRISTFEDVNLLCDLGGLVSAMESVDRKLNIYSGEKGDEWDWKSSATQIFFSDAPVGTAFRSWLAMCRDTGANRQRAIEVA